MGCATRTRLTTAPATTPTASIRSFSLLETDFYKLLMQQFLWENYRNEQVGWRLTNCSKRVTLGRELPLEAVLKPPLTTPYSEPRAWPTEDAARLGFEAAVLKPLTRAIAMSLSGGKTTADEAEAGSPRCVQLIA